MFKFNKRPSFLCFLFFTLIFLGFIIALPFGYQDSFSEKAVEVGESPCTILVSTKIEVNRSGVKISPRKNSGVIYRGPNNGYFAVEKGKDIQIEATCQGLASPSVHYWNFGKHCGSWEEATWFEGTTGSESKVLHRFDENGDYTITLWAQSGGKSFLQRIKVGVYSRDVLVDQGFQQEVRDGERSEKDLDIEILLGPGSRLAGYYERRCLFRGQQEGRDIGFRKLVLANDQQSLKGSQFYLPKNEALWLDSHCHARGSDKVVENQFLNFWEDPFLYQAMRGRVSKLISILQAPVGERARASLNIEGLTLTHRLENENIIYPTCNPPGL